MQVMEKEQTSISIELVTLRELVVAKVFTEGGGDPILDEIRAEVERRKSDMDISTPAGREVIRSTAYQIAKAKEAIDKKGFEYNATLKELPKKVDAERKRIKDTLEALQKEVRSPLTAYEEAEANRIQTHEANIAAIDECAEFDGWPTSAQIKDHITECAGLHADVDFQEFASRAAKTRGDALASLDRLLETTLKKEKDAADLERLRQEQAVREQQEREEQIRKDAEAKANREAAERERIAQEKAADDLRRAEQETQRAINIAAKAQEDRKAAECKAEQDKKDAEICAKRQQEEAVETERRRADAERLKAEREAAQREANKKHKTKIHNEIVAAFVEAGLNQEQALIAGQAVVGQKIPHVSVQY